MGEDRACNFYKSLGFDMQSIHGGSGVWSVGEWMPDKDPVPCQSGYHLCREDDLLDWLGPRLFLAEARGRIVESDGKVTAQSARLVRELSWDCDVWVNHCLARAGISQAGATLAEAIASGDDLMIAVCSALLAASLGADIAVQQVPRRAAQAVAWREYRRVVEDAWSLSGGNWPAWRWRSVERRAQLAKESAYLAERDEQLAWVLELDGGRCQLEIDHA